MTCSCLRRGQGKQERVTRFDFLIKLEFFPICAKLSAGTSGLEKMLLKLRFCDLEKTRLEERAKFTSTNYCFCRLLVWTDCLAMFFQNCVLTFCRNWLNFAILFDQNSFSQIFVFIIFICYLRWLTWPCDAKKLDFVWQEHEELTLGAE